MRTGYWLYLRLSSCCDAPLTASRESLECHEPNEALRPVCRGIGILYEPESGSYIIKSKRFKASSFTELYFQDIHYINF